jgi:hypothetical protein
MFWEGFYKSCEEYFCQNSEKNYFVFTDAEDVKYTNENSRINIIFQKKLGWPFDTLFRFKMFNTIDKQLENFDYIFFFNSNMVFQKSISESILPNNQEKLLAVLHPGFFDKPRTQFTYETNEKSLAFIPNDKGLYYFMGGFNGGIANNYIALIKKLEKNIEIDFKKGIIALWHDESHLNNYLVDRTPKILSPAFGYPDDTDIPFEKNIIILNKSNFGGHDFLRDIRKENKIIRFFQKVFSKR